MLDEYADTDAAENGYLYEMPEDGVFLPFQPDSAEAADDGNGSTPYVPFAEEEESLLYAESYPPQSASQPVAADEEEEEEENQGGDYYFDNAFIPQDEAYSTGDI